MLGVERIAHMNRKAEGLWVQGRGLIRVFYALNPLIFSNSSVTWTPKVCKLMAFMAVIMGLGLLCYILLGFV